MPRRPKESGSHLDDSEYYGVDPTSAWVARQSSENTTYDGTYRERGSRRTQPLSYTDRYTQDQSYQDNDGRTGQAGGYSQYSRGYEPIDRYTERYDAAPEPSHRRRRDDDDARDEGDESRFSWQRAAAAAAVVGAGMYAMKRIDDDYEEGKKALQAADEKAERREARRLRREQEAEEARYQEEEAATREYERQEKEERRRRRRLGY
jgi:hypothetical protein